MNKIELVPIDSIKQIAINPRKIDKKGIERLVQSIKEFPEMLELRSIIIDENMDIIGGNQRYLACKKAGYKEVPVLRANGLTEDQKKEFMIKDNTHVGEFYIEGLEKFNIDLGSLKDWGVDVDLSINVEPAETIGDDEAPDVNESEIITKLGDLWELGDHRLLCGDSTKIEYVARLMNGEKAVLFFTDPPYGMKKEKDGVLNDNLNYNDLLEFNKKWIPLNFQHLTDNGSWYCWGIDQPLMDIYSEILKPMIKDNKITFRNLITWNKGNGQGQMSEYFRSYPIADEKCLFVMCGVQGFSNNADNYFDGWEGVRKYIEYEIKSLNKNDKEIATNLGYKDGRTVNHWWNKSQWAFITEDNYNSLKSYAETLGFEIFKKEYEEIKKEYEEIKKIAYAKRAYFNNTHDNMNNVWNIARHIKDGSEGDHATPKPILLCDRGIISSSRENDIVSDFFGGSGSTLISCEKNNRISRLMELTPKYCDVIVRRYVKFCKDNNRSYSVKLNGKEFDLGLL